MRVSEPRDKTRLAQAPSHLFDIPSRLFIHCRVVSCRPFAREGRAGAEQMEKKSREKTRARGRERIYSRLRKEYILGVGGHQLYDWEIGETKA